MPEASVTGKEDYVAAFMVEIGWYRVITRPLDLFPRGFFMPFRKRKGARVWKEY